MEWLNEASLSTDIQLKAENLSKVQEIMINKEPLLLNTSFLDEILHFANHKNKEIKNVVAAFIEEAGLV